MIVTWLGFSVIYYGFPFSSSFYSKLAINISKVRLINHGLVYHIDLILNDPMTFILIITSAVFLAKEFKKDFFSESKITYAASLVAMLLYETYIIYVGGDFMSGRFFLPLVAIASLEIVRLNPFKNVPLRKLSIATVFTLIVIFGLGSKIRDQLFQMKFVDSYAARIFAGKDPCSFAHPLFDSDMRTCSFLGVMNERGHYYESWGLLSAHNSLASLDQDAENWNYDNDNVVCKYVEGGVSGITLGPSFHLYESIGLNDPLLARMPIIVNSSFAPGHYLKHLPLGYQRMYDTNGESLKDLGTRKLFKSLQIITTGPIFRKERFQEIIRHFTGYYDPIIKSLQLRFGSASLENCPMTNNPGKCFASINNKAFRWW